MENTMMERRIGGDRREKPRFYFLTGGRERRKLPEGTHKKEEEWQGISSYWSRAV